MPSLVSPVLDISSRLTRLHALLARLRPVPESWGNGKARPRRGGDSGEMTPLPCRSYRELIQAWRRAMRWTDGLDCALSVMLASVASTKAVGDQLWVKIISPPSTGKSSLCEAISVAQRYVVAKSTIRGFHSGWKGKDSEEDFSLIAQIKNKTLVTKDGDTLLQSPNLGQILAEARDIYDSVSRSHYRSGTGKDYSGIRCTWILAGTSSLKQIDSSELGERFLDCVIMHGIDDDLEDDILWRVANRANRNMALEADGCADTHYEPELAEAMRLTGGYVEYLRENASDLLAQTTTPEWALRRCTRLGKFVAYMRARPSKKQDETKERELAARLVSQHLRLAKCLAVVMNYPEVDKEPMRRTHKVAVDTARGTTLNLAQRLYEISQKGEPGMESDAIEWNTGMAPEVNRSFIRFLRHIRVLERIEGAGRNQVKYGLTPQVHKLWAEVMK